MAAGKSRSDDVPKQLPVGVISETELGLTGIILQQKAFVVAHMFDHS